MAFQADQNIKSQILTSLGTDQIFRLLSDPDVNTLMKTLGLLRNLLSTKPVGTILFIVKELIVTDYVYVYAYV